MTPKSSYLGVALVAWLTIALPVIAEPTPTPLPEGQIKAHRIASDVFNPGWDWSRFPGATVTRLSLDKAELLVMALNRNAKSNPANSGLKAQKSFHCFNDIIVCLGSSISHPNSKDPVETLLFQQHLKKADHPIGINGKDVSALPYDKTFTSPTLLCDVVGNYYHIPGKQDLRISRQSSHTNSHQARAWLDHGTQTKNASYHYSVLVSPNKERVEAWKNSRGYTLLRHDSGAHIVAAGNTTSYALFKAGKAEAVPQEGKPNPAVIKVSAPCLIITKLEENTLKLYLTGSDLRTPSEEDEIFNSKGNGPIIVTLNGPYTLQSGIGVAATTVDGKTTLNFNTDRGRTLRCVLK
ncbi:hypothetical protein NT6N_20680 [Oceaniferula spumae]|uniref:Polysaccharide lyase family 8 central domain-containing protein n=1 Tax=Oceaniferula spumae TaxID=2979115 RepID=A0AAT9FM41_9BACT